jgi:glycosyltransferase involved in cell wall biosynthesis
MARGAPRAPPPALPLQGCCTVVIPALNEARRIADVVRYALGDPATAEVIVVDDSSIDETASLARAAGARVITSTMLGKGASMHDGLQAASKELIVYLDGDLAGLQPGIVSELCRPLLEGSADFVKARFGRSGGRVTVLTAKPMLAVFFPEVAQLAQPLGGMVAARRELLAQLTFEDGYGVDIGLLLDALHAGARIVEVDIGKLEHDSQSLADLAAMANEVARVIHNRARRAGRLTVDQIDAMYEAQRQATASVEHVLARRRGRRSLLLLAGDGVITQEDFFAALARHTGQPAAYAEAANEPRHAARLFRFAHKRSFELAAREMALAPGVVLWVNRMRREGFMVGVVSHGVFIAAEILRRRVFADFALAHTIGFDDGVCTGELRPNPAWGGGQQDDAERLLHALRRAMRTMTAAADSSASGPSAWPHATASCCAPLTVHSRWAPEARCRRAWSAWPRSTS